VLYAEALHWLAQAQAALGESALAAQNQARARAILTTSDLPLFRRLASVQRTQPMA